MKSVLVVIILLAAAPRPTERVVAGDGAVAGALNGNPVRWRIDPAGTAMPLVTTVLANGARLKSGMFGIAYDIGPVRLYGKTALAKIDFGTGAIKRRVGWVDRPYAVGFDGVVGPGGLPDTVVRFALHASFPGERTVTLPMEDGGGVMGGWSQRHAVVTVGGQPMQVVFDPYHPRTLANAGAAGRLAETFGGTLSGTTGPQEIAFGIERPVRTLTLAQPFTVGTLAITSLGVRTGDGGSASGIADADAPRSDPDEVVVVARGTKHDPAPRPRVDRRRSTRALLGDRVR